MAVAVAQIYWSVNPVLIPWHLQNWRWGIYAHHHHSLLTAGVFYLKRYPSGVGKVAKLQKKGNFGINEKINHLFSTIFLQKQTHDFQFLKISGFEGNIHQAERSQGVGLSWLSSAHQRGIAATSKQTKTQIQPFSVSIACVCRNFLSRGQFAQ